MNVTWTTVDGLFDIVSDICCESTVNGCGVDHDLLKKSFKLLNGAV